MKSLRDYQKAALGEISDLWAAGQQRVLLCLPTGAGKTVIFSHLARQIADAGGNVLILANRRLLIRQTSRILVEMGIFPSHLLAANHSIHNERVTLSMPKTLRNRLKLQVWERYFSKTTHIIIDEAHYGEFFWIFDDEILKGKKILGVTATPISARKDVQMKDLYNEIVCPVTTRELIDRGALVDARFFSAKRDLAQLVLRGGEFTEESQQAVFSGAAMYGDVVKHYKEHAEGRPFVIFNPNQLVAKEMAEAFSAAGYPCEYVASGNEEVLATSQDEIKIITEKLAKGELVGISNAAILVAGADLPICSAIILNFATTVRTKYVQSIGRGARPHAESGKVDFIVIDMGENQQRLGSFTEMWDRRPGRQPRLISGWQELFYFPNVPKAALPKTKDCPVCFALQAKDASICTNCGLVFTIAPPEPKSIGSPKNIVMVDFAEVGQTGVEAEVGKLLQKGKENGFKPLWAYHRSKDLGFSGLEAYAKLVGKYDGWAVQELANEKRRFWEDIKAKFGVENGGVVVDETNKMIQKGVDYLVAEGKLREKYDIKRLCQQAKDHTYKNTRNLSGLQKIKT